jgi:3-deoxy-D-manno-octulosonic-acid transferase
LDLVRAAYHSVSNSLEPVAHCFLSARLQENPLFWQGRFGYYATETPAHGRPRLWLHAASVGEVTGAIPIVRTLREQLPGAAITLTVTTPQGFQFARTNLSSWAQILPFPLDFPPVLERAFRSLRPDLYVALESEFWPNLFRLLEQHQTPAILLNGQLSRRSTIWYGLFKPLFQPVFRQFVGLAMHAEEDRRNVLLLGVPPERTCVLGSSKYDALVLRKDPAKVRSWRQVLDLPEGVPTMVGGSLRRQECVTLLEVFHTLKNLDSSLVGIFAPRHLKQIPNMAAWLNGQGIDFQLFSQFEKTGAKRTSSVILVDSIGLLFELYGLGDLVFCGGTLEPIGAHNIVEPAAWGKAVFYGPHLQKVADEHNILQAFRGSFLVQNAEDLLHQWQHWLRHLSGLQLYGENAQAALSKLGGVSARQVELIMSTLSEHKSGEVRKAVASYSGQVHTMK